jgi:hypothetical protein
MASGHKHAWPGGLTIPQCLQWWRRRKKEKAVLHFLQFGASRSVCHCGAVCNPRHDSLSVDRFPTPCACVRGSLESRCRRPLRPASKRERKPTSSPVEGATRRPQEPTSRAKVDTRGRYTKRSFGPADAGVRRSSRQVTPRPRQSRLAHTRAATVRLQGSHLCSRPATVAHLEPKYMSRRTHVFSLSAAVPVLVSPSLLSPLTLCLPSSAGGRRSWLLFFSFALFFSSPHPRSATAVPRYLATTPPPSAVAD